MDCILQGGSAAWSCLGQFGGAILAHIDLNRSGHQRNSVQGVGPNGGHVLRHVIQHFSTIRELCLQVVYSVNHGGKNRINVLEDLSVVMLQAPLESGSVLVSLVVKLPVHGTSNFPSSTLTELCQRVG